ncbi:B12-binding domain-containing radical SAM protein [Streptomyces phaeochromogenes]|uniref:B12-binding domain-containing radical SAM protein n=1 Tax=Streptomyces phaeochromogenes TaxID=1923 RepID=UPI002DD88886|nr:radical SAM protein [Streptomyces phaeochromogenes]WRZ30952.1 B12-binding domain-containing radical SAM protein [Streptomyces phaeochromogenes]
MGTLTRPDIAFVNPSVGFSDRRKSKPIGLAYIMAYLEKSGFPSSGFDFGDSEDDAVELAAHYGLDRFDVVGFSVYNESFRAAIAMAEWIKNRRPECLIVLGGPHATAVHEHILRRYSCVDVVVRREGEEAMLDLVRGLDAGPGVDAGDRAGLTGIKGTTWRAPDGGGLLVNEDRDFVPDLDQIPFPDAEFTSHSGYPDLTYYDEVQGRLKAALTICSSRSCPYNCSFCGVLTIGRKYRSREAERVVAELLHFRARHGVNYEHVYFSDANFFVSPTRALEVAEALYEADPQVTFSFGTRVNQILKAAEVLPRLKECGLRFIELGIESASEPVLERLAKHVKPEVNVAAVRLLRRLGIEISLDFIMLDPATTLPDVRANLEFLCEAGFYDYVPHDHLYTALVLYEGTPIRDFYARRFGVVFDPDDLPSPFTLFELPEVQRFSDTLRAFRKRWQDRIDDALAQGELALASMADGSDGLRGPDDSYLPRASHARLQLDVVSLRHAPNLFMERLLEDAEAGFPLLDEGGDEAGDDDGLEALLPRLGHDHVHLNDLIERTEAVAREAGFAQAPGAAAPHGRD